jgi:hypothetical protein
MKRTRLLIAVVAVGLILAMTATTVAAFSFVTLKPADYNITFNYGSCKVTTQEAQTEHMFLGRHFLSTIAGSITLEGTCTLPITTPPIQLPTPATLPFAAVDVFNPFGDTYSIRSYGMAVVPASPLPVLIATPVRVGVNVWRVQKSPPAWCGYGYLYTVEKKYMLLPFRGESTGLNEFKVIPGACLDSVPPQ